MNKVITFESIDSTNLYARKLIEQGIDEEFIVISKEQKRGKGQKDRTFYSPNDKGIYFTIGILIDIPISDLCYVTPISGISVIEELIKHSQSILKIKWINDIYKSNKKVSGILTETIKGKWIIIGIGININKDENIPYELTDKITNVLNEDEYVDKIHLAQNIGNRIYYYINNLNKEKIVKKYKEHSMILNQYVNVEKKDILKKAYVIDINDRCGLVVRYECGKIEELNSGRIHLLV